jgi:hypothetical protein
LIEFLVVCQVLDLKNKTLHHTHPRKRCYFINWHTTKVFYPGASLIFKIAIFRTYSMYLKPVIQFLEITFFGPMNIEKKNLAAHPHINNKYLSIGTIFFQPP